MSANESVHWSSGFPVVVRIKVAGRRPVTLGVRTRTTTREMEMTFETSAILPTANGKETRHPYGEIVKGVLDMKKLSLLLIALLLTGCPGSDDAEDTGAAQSNTEPPTEPAPTEGNVKVGMFEGFKEAAEHGNADAQLQLAEMYRYGEGVAADNVEAYKWARLAGGGKGQTLCEALAKEMTPQQIAEAKRRATEFVPKSGESPDPKQRE